METTTHHQFNWDCLPEAAEALDIISQGDDDIMEGMVLSGIILALRGFIERDACLRLRGKDHERLHENLEMIENRSARGQRRYKIAWDSVTDLPF